jgi:hypothetical protein
VFLSFS